jgi:hypothetical protein
MIAEFFISLAVLAVDVALVGLGLLVLGGLYAVAWCLMVAVGERLTKRPRATVHPLPTAAYQRFTERSTWKRQP